MPWKRKLLPLPLIPSPPKNQIQFFCFTAHGAVIMASTGVGMSIVAVVNKPMVVPHQIVTLRPCHCSTGAV
jgi:hypothetical protein